MEKTMVSEYVDKRTAEEIERDNIEAEEEYERWNKLSDQQKYELDMMVAQREADYINASR